MRPRLFQCKATLCIIFLLLCIAGSTPVAGQIPITLTNHQDQPIWADAVTIDADAVYDALDLSEPTPVRFYPAEGGDELPALLTNQNDHSAIWVFVDLEANERLDLIATAGSSWSTKNQLYSAIWNSGTETGALRNGLVHLDYANKSIAMGYDRADLTGDAHRMLESIYFRGWLDTIDRGSVIDPEAEGLVLVDTRSAVIAQASAGLVNDEPTLTLVRSFSGFGAPIQLTETITLLDGLPALRYHLDFHNTGPSTRYLAWAEGNIYGTHVHAQLWNRSPYWLDDLFLLADESVTHHVKYWYNPPAWCWCTTWPLAGSGIGYSTLGLFTQSHYHNKTLWTFSQDNFTLAQVGSSQGYLPIPIPPGGHATMGARFLLTLPATDHHGQMQTFFTELNQGNVPERQRPYAVFVDGRLEQGAYMGYLGESFASPNRWEVTQGQLTSGPTGGQLTATSGQATVACGLQMDLTAEHLLNMTISDLSPGATLQLIARPLDDPAATVVLAHVDNLPGPDPSRLVLHYPFDEISGNWASDATGNYDGLVVAPLWDSAGYQNGCLSFNGANFVKVFDPAPLFAGIQDSITYSVWVYGDPAYQPYYDAILYGNNSTSGTEHNPLIYLPNSNGRVRYEYGSPTADVVEWVEATPTDWQGQWNHYAFTKNSSQGRMRIYCNGTLVAENLNAYGSIAETTRLIIGGIDRGTYQSLLYHGKLDEFRIYNYELSAEEIDYLAHPDLQLATEFPTAMTLPFYDETGWTGAKQFALEFHLSGPIGAAATIESITLGPPPPTAPQAIAPVAGDDLTDIAVHFSWSKIDGIVEYELQWDDDPAFASPNSQIVTGAYEQMLHLPTPAPSAGAWNWRVRGIDAWGQAGEWSTTQAFTVNDDHVHIPLVRPITTEHPLFTFEAFKFPDLGVLQGVMPSDIRPYTAIVAANNYSLTQQTNRQYFAPIRHQDNDYLLRPTGPGSQEGSLTDIEYLFQTCPNVIGICVGELFWDYWKWEEIGREEYFTRLIMLCAKYGRAYVWGDGNGTTFKWQQYASDPYWLPFARSYSDYLFFSMKDNVNLTMFSSQGALMGMWLSDMISGYGEWCECWYWNDAGFGELDEYLGTKLGNVHDFPRNFYNITFMLGLAQGKTVFNIDGQCTTGSTQPAIWNNQGQTTETFHRYIVPFIRGVTAHQVVPSRAAVKERIKVAIAQPDRFENIAHSGAYGIYEPLYSGTYGFRPGGQWFEYIPNTGKYYFIPLLPYDTPNLGPDIHIETLADMDSVATVQTVFDTHYPTAYPSAALVNQVGDSVFIQNTHENSDVTESYQITLNRPNLAGMSGAIGPHKYIMGKFENNGCSLWLQANTEYPQRNTSMSFDCLWEPRVTVTPTAALVQQNWDAPSGALTITVTHTNGAVDIILDSADLNRDGDHNLGDIGAFAEQWLSAGPMAMGDTNADGIVNIDDFVVLLRALSTD